MGKLLGCSEELMRDHWFEDIADRLGSAYLRYSFTKGTSQEVDFIVAETGLRADLRVLDVGCGPGRHALELARRGYAVEGMDISDEFIRVARESARAEGLDRVTFFRADARDLLNDESRRASFDVVICLCQGAFGMMRSPDDDHRVFAGLSQALRPGGVLVLSAFNAYFQVRYHHEASFDVATGVSHERTTVRDPQGGAHEVDLWTGCFTPKELRALARAHHLEVLGLYGAEPGSYGHHAPSLELPEYLLVARRKMAADSV